MRWTIWAPVLLGNAAHTAATAPATCGAAADVPLTGPCPRLRSEYWPKVVRVFTPGAKMHQRFTLPHRVLDQELPLNAAVPCWFSAPTAMAWPAIPVCATSEAGGRVGFASPSFPREATTTRPAWAMRRIPRRMGWV